MSGREARADGQPLGYAMDAERADDGVAAPQLLGAFVPGVAFVADVIVVSTGVPVGNQAVHDGGDDHAEEKPEHDLAQVKRVKARLALHTLQRLGEQAQGGGGQHEARTQAQDAVVGPAGQPADEEEREGPQASGQAGQTSGGEG